MNRRVMVIGLVGTFIFGFLYTTRLYAAIQEDLQKANQSFTYNSKPIHPGLVQEFSNWISDNRNPITISVDISAGSDTNEYSDSRVTANEEGAVCRQGQDGESFCYHWLGRLINGVHVLRVTDSGGGSGIFGDLFFVKFEVGQGYMSDGKKYDRLLMSIMLTYPLGDRYDGNIRFEKDRIVVGSGKNHTKQDVITFDDVPSVQEIQKALKAVGFYTGVVDGQESKSLTEAVKAFQKARGLNIDGMVGQHTWVLLRKAK